MSKLQVRTPLLLTLALLLLSPLASSQIYSWVDENGKQHFGDQIPSKYQDQATEYEVPDTNSAEAVDIDTTRPPANSRPRTSAPRADSSSSQPPSLAGGAKPAPNSCAERKAAYEESASCFSACRMLGNNNIANCGHCKQMRKPDC